MLNDNLLYIMATVSSVQSVKMSSEVAILLLLSATGISLSAPQQEGASNVGIMYTNYTDISNYNFTVAITAGVDLLGGGVLVRQRWVLTAANVTLNVNVTEVRVRVGSNSPHTGGYSFRVAKIIPHPKYATNQSYNIALLKLGWPVNRTMAHPISYLARIPFNDNWSKGNVTGYGRTNEYSKNEEDPGLEIIQLTLYTTQHCNKFMEVPGTQFCAYTPPYIPCIKDLGDPMTRCYPNDVCELLGIFTGINACYDEQPTVYTDTGYFYPWIVSTIKSH